MAIDDAAAKPASGKKRRTRGSLARGTPWSLSVRPEGRSRSERRRDRSVDPVVVLRFDNDRRCDGRSKQGLKLPGVLLKRFAAGGGEVISRDDPPVAAG